MSTVGILDEFDSSPVRENIPLPPPPQINMGDVDYEEQNRPEGEEDKDAAALEALLEEDGEPIGGGAVAPSVRFTGVEFPEDEPPPDVSRGPTPEPDIDRLDPAGHRCGQRRQRTMSDDGMSTRSDIDIPSAKRQRCMERVASCTSRDGLGPSEHHELLEHSRMDGATEASIDLRSGQLKQGMKDTQTEWDRAAAQLASGDFLKILHERLYMLLVQPGVGSYVNNLPNYAYRILKDNAAAWGIPLIMVTDPILYGRLCSAISEGLTQGRHALKRLIWSGMNKRLDIYTFTSTIVPISLDINCDHWHRMAFLRQYAKKFVEVWTKPVKKGEKPRTVYKSDNFWKYIDDALTAVRAKYAKLSEADRATSREAFFKTYMDKDYAMYGKHVRRRIGAPNVAAMTVWQLECQREMCWLDV